MKKQILIILALLTTADIFSCNLCWDYPRGQRLRQIPIQKITDCNCECWKYSKTRGDNNYYICTECRHRLMPESIFIPKTKNTTRYKSKRWKQKSKKRKLSAYNRLASSETKIF